jgi:hypothetical protein
MMFFHHAKKVTYTPSSQLSEHCWSASMAIENGVETVIHLFFETPEDGRKCDAAMREAVVDHGTHSVGAISISLHFIKKSRATREENGFTFDFGTEAIRVFS